MHLVLELLRAEMLSAAFQISLLYLVSFGREFVGYPLYG